MTARKLCPKCSSIVIQESVVDSASRETTYFHYKCINKKCKLRFTVEESRKGKKVRDAMRRERRV